MRLLDDIIDKEIIDYHANIIGKVKDLEIDSSSYKIESIIVKNNNKKLKKNNINEEKIPFEEVGNIGDKIILKKPLSDIDSILSI